LQIVACISAQRLQGLLPTNTWVWSSCLVLPHACRSANRIIKSFVSVAVLFRRSRSLPEADRIPTLKVAALVEEWFGDNLIRRGSVACWHQNIAEDRSGLVVCWIVGVSFIPIVLIPDSGIRGGKWQSPGQHLIPGPMSDNAGEHEAAGSKLTLSRRRSKYHSQPCIPSAVAEILQGRRTRWCRRTLSTEICCSPRRPS
jgi:hypothetical protein